MLYQKMTISFTTSLPCHSDCQPEAHQNYHPPLPLSCYQDSLMYAAQQIEEVKSIFQIGFEDRMNPPVIRKSNSPTDIGHHKACWLKIEKKELCLIHLQPKGNKIAPEQRSCCSQKHEQLSHCWSSSTALLHCDNKGKMIK